MTRRFREDQSGLTLIELLVVMLLLGIIGSILSTVMIGSLKTSQRQQDQTATLTSAKVAMERMTRDIRGANSMTYAAPRKMTFVTTFGTTRTVTTLSVVTSGGDTEIRQTQVVTDLASGSSSTKNLTVLGGLAIGRSDAVFTFADGGGTPLTPVTPSPVTYSAGAVKSVGVHVLVRRLYGSPPAELKQIVSIRNFEVS